MDRMGQGRQVQLEMKIATRVASSGISFRTETSQNAQLSRLRLLIFSETLQKPGREEYFNWHSLCISIGMICEHARLVKEYFTKKKSFRYTPASSPPPPTFEVISLWGVLLSYRSCCSQVWHSTVLPIYQMNPLVTRHN